VSAESQQTTDIANEGTLSFIVWPTHVGAVNEAGEEPMGHPDYDRGQITWALNEQGRLVGSAKINVPRGHRDWTHIIYCHNPIKPGFITAQKLHHPLRLPDGGTIDLIDITDGDVAVLNPEAIHD
jgi:hypothetical protein